MSADLPINSAPMSQNVPPLPTDSIASAPEPSEQDLPNPTPDTPNPLSTRQLAALELMLAGLTDVAIAAELKIARRSLYRWRTHDPAFRNELLRRRDDLYGQSTDRFRHLINRAFDTLEKQVKDNYNPTSHRAARTLLVISRIGQHLAPKPAPLPILKQLHQSS